MKARPVPPRGKTRRISALRAVLLDFDGVVLDSADIKTAAFQDLFAARPRWIPRILAYHRRNAGVSRFVKFAHIYRRFFRKPLTEAEKRQLGKRFSDLVMNRVLRVAFVPGMRNFLKGCRKRFQFYVVSGTPQRELRFIVRKRGLQTLFQGVYGSPCQKKELIYRILKRKGFSPAEAVYVGDGPSDHQAARHCGIRFIGRVPAGGLSPFPKGTPLVRDGHGLRSILAPTQRHGPRMAEGSKLR